MSILTEADVNALIVLLMSKQAELKKEMNLPGTEISLSAYQFVKSDYLKYKELEKNLENLKIILTRIYCQKKS